VTIYNFCTSLLHFQSISKIGDITSPDFLLWEISENTYSHQLHRKVTKSKSAMQ